MDIIDQQPDISLPVPSNGHLTEMDTPAHPPATTGGMEEDLVFDLKNAELWIERRVERVEESEDHSQRWLAGFDPQIEFGGPLDIPLGEYQSLLVRMAVPEETSDQSLEIYYRIDDDEEYTASSCLRTRLNADGHMHTYEFSVAPMRRNRDSRLSGLRLDPVNGYFDGSHLPFEIAHVCLARQSLNGLAERISSAPFIRKSTPVVIDVHQVSKSYQPRGRQISLRHEAGKWLRYEVSRRLRHMSNLKSPAEHDAFWALRDVTFDVRSGESVGIVGNNGSGKTTLLRILSRVTSPTLGRVSVVGRYAALLGLNAGFNYERTGRENIYLNAAILGMRRKEVAEMMDEIVDFAELGEFIDAPVKLYSSGMVTRLGFSVAIHVSPDMIFLDEALAVGDLGFQSKCIARIHAMRDEGRTLLFVAHMPVLLQQLCERALWLDQGRLLMDGSSDEVLRAYQTSTRMTERTA